ncbi:hypothetical protein FIBSPDRAFT_852647 [Athelia psychrophila]|uniref:Uncharacterized protein n=1 Tax=Athelia psychrophila TaxID=1759441 RepID=A0A166RPL4_9AGAM|nr:hypothetical protein FIBSPDRAFT_852647 [Fibularhizoctonia sp. CBS 109695]
MSESSSVKTSALIRRVMAGVDRQCCIEGVSMDLYDKLDNLARSRDDMARWEGTRVELCDETLVVGHPTSIGHEIMGHLFTDLCRDGGGQPEGFYNGAQIITGGTTDVRLADGIKVPDYSLYALTANPSSSLSHTLNSYPTVAWEVAYSETERKLARDAARLICFSHGLVQLVVTINITHMQVATKELATVRCSCWEMDLDAFEKAPAKADPSRKINVLSPEGDGTPPKAYRGTVKFGENTYHVRAKETQSCQVYPKPEKDALHILRRHLYREPSEGEEDDVVFAIPTADILRVVLSHEQARASHDEDKARKNFTESDADTLIQALLSKKSRTRE